MKTLFMTMIGLLFTFLSFSQNSSIISEKTKAHLLSRHVDVQKCSEAFNTPYTQVSDPIDLHRLTLVVFDTTYWDAALQTIDGFDTMGFPIGSTVIECEDRFITDKGEHAHDFAVKAGRFRGTEFTVVLPNTANGADLTNGNFGRFTSYGYINLSHKGTLLSSPPVTVADPLFNGNQPHLNGNNAGVIFNNINLGWGIWQAFVPKTGYHVRNLHFDSGIDSFHTDINTSMIIAGYNYGDGNAIISDSNGHGTATGGALFAKTNNSFGIVGVDPHDTVLIMKVNYGTTTSFFVSSLNTAYNAALSTLGGRQANANMSLGFTTYDPTFATTIANGISAYSCWAIGASGNSGSFSNTTYPACYPNVFNIGGSTYSGAAWSGETTSDSMVWACQAQNLDLPLYHSGTGFTLFSGTSGSAPQSTGLIAMARSMFPSFSMGQIRSAIIAMCNGGGVHTTNLGYGIITDSLVQRKLESYVLQSDTLYYTTCTGNQPIGRQQLWYAYTDSNNFGNPAIGGVANGFINTNLLSAGTYTIKHTFSFMPLLPGYSTPWHDTINQVIVITGSGGTVPVDSITTPATTVCTGTPFTLTAAGNAASSHHAWYKYHLGTWTYVGTGLTYTTTLGAPITDTFKCVDSLYSLAGCWTKVYDTATKIITVVTAPTITITGITTICAGNSTTLIASGATTYTWTPATGLSCTACSNPTANPTSTTTYTVVGLSGGSCTGATTVTVTVNPAPTVTVTGTTSICAGSSTGLAASGATSYVWTPAIGLTCTGCSNPTASPSATTTYSINGTTGGCHGTTSVTVTVNSLPVVSISGVATICNGSSTSLTASGAASYIWSSAIGLSCTGCSNPTANPTTTTTYSITGTTGSCLGSTTVTVSVNPLPTVTVPSITICTGSFGTLTATGATTYLWSPATGLSSTTGTTVTASPSGTSIYTITGTASGCNGVTTTTVTVAPSLTVIVPPIGICSGSSGILTASGASSYTWTPAIGLSSTTGTSVTANPSGTTIYTIVGTSGACSGITTSTVEVTPALTVITVGNTICNGDTAAISAMGATSYIWSPAIGLSCITCASSLAYPTTTTIYTVVGTVGGCNDTSTAIVSVNSTMPLLANISHVGSVYTLTTSATAYTVHWFVNGVLTATFTSVPTWTHTVTPGHTDTVFAVVMPLAGCYAPDSLASNTITVTASLGITSVNEPAVITIYPNPCTSYVIVSGMKHGDLLTLIDIHGREVLYYKFTNDGTEKISLPMLCTGVYIARLRSENGITNKILILHE